MRLQNYYSLSVLYSVPIQSAWSDDRMVSILKLSGEEAQPLHRLRL